MPVSPRAYVQFRTLPAECQPCIVARRADRFLVVGDPDAPRTAIVEWCVSNLFPDELNALRLAYGEPVCGESLSDVWFLDAPMMRWIPEAVRVPGDPVYVGAWDTLTRDLPLAAS